MKLVLRILNLAMAALGLVATILLFSMPAFSFNSKVVVGIDTLTSFIPETEYTKDIKATDLLGTDEIQAGVSFKLSAAEINKVMNGDREIINERVIIKNLDETLQTLDDAVDIITDNTVRKTLQSTIKAEITKQIDAARPIDSDKSAEEIMDLLALDEIYFKNFANSLYDEANKSSATVNSVGNVLQEQIDDALLKAEKSNAIKPGTFTEEAKQSVKNNLINILNQLEMVEGEKIKPIGDLPYIYVTKYAKEKLATKLSPGDLEQKTGETNRQYSDRMLEALVVNVIPETVYQIIGYVCLGMFIGIFVIAGAWLGFAAFEVLHFFFVEKKHKLFKSLFLPFFMLVGLIQIGLGFVLTGVCKYVLPEKLDLASLNIPVKEAIIIPRTCTLATSIVFIITVGVGIAYFVIKLITPKAKV